MRQEGSFLFTYYYDFPLNHNSDAKKNNRRSDGEAKKEKTEKMKRQSEVMMATWQGNEPTRNCNAMIKACRPSRWVWHQRSWSSSSFTLSLEDPIGMCWVCCYLEEVRFVREHVCVCVGMSHFDVWENVWGISLLPNPKNILKNSRINLSRWIHTWVKIN